jgi:hypothetical protein
MKNAYKIFVGKSEEERPHEGPVSKWNLYYNGP